MKKAIYTAIIGGYDEFTEPKVIQQGFDYHLFTNLEIESELYTIHKVDFDSADKRENILKAREIKLLPHKYLPEYNFTIWVDANLIQLKDISDIIQNQTTDLQIMKHSCRDCIYQEAEACISQHKDNEQIINEQIQRYKNEQYPAYNGMVASGIMLRKKTKKMQTLCEFWFNELQKGSIRDQLSFNYSLWKNPMQIQLMNYDDLIFDSFNKVCHKVKLVI